ncbi:uncharacterized protein LOC143274910 isoform X2 [Babylonia areolata]|uniref:uncharacterized protein LOC143274910 isoform X2 n=1 Tax=Babylonia areolata TaxID=304850 RepID=UPI003FD1469D
MPRMKQTNEVMKLTNHVAILVIVLASLARPLEGRVCTRVRSEQGVKVVSYPGECHQSFEANCGWFSFQKCVFNETVPCLKTRNITGTIYRIVEDCCPGYHKNRDGRCVGQAGGTVDWQGERYEEDVADREGRVTSLSHDTGPEDWDPDSGQVSDGGDEDDDDTFFLGISHGAYAGIICGILFIACVALLTAVHYRKRKLQEQKKNAMAADQEAAQRQQMIPLEKMDAAAPVAT